MLRKALEAALLAGAVITDEASAVEHANQYPLLLEGHGDNLKITQPEDLPLAEFYFSQTLPTR
jgi:2-C-methyl-D-erythritol 4-phosphate cytidylyltransferase